MESCPINIRLVLLYDTVVLVKVARKDREAFDCATVHKARELPKEGSRESWNGT
jgi:hypothetical protein